MCDTGYQGESCDDPFVSVFSPRGGGHSAYDDELYTFTRFVLSDLTGDAACALLNPDALPIATARVLRASIEADDASPPCPVGRYTISGACCSGFECPDACATYFVFEDQAAVLERTASAGFIDVSLAGDGRCAVDFSLGFGAGETFELEHEFATPGFRQDTCF
jgi:hypothetical protein